MISADDPFLNQPQLMGSGGNVSELKQDGAYLYFLKSGLENMGIHTLITRSGISLVSTAIEDGRVTPAARFLARLSQTVGTGEADLIVVSQDMEDDGGQGE
ncbi:hypothetical protein JCM24511_04616 [Saitozyma sp. JCM 24511]|nr:hypothetical protein JCM24511_04616 [Saitozyma sp. JCM 24511]